MSEANVPPQPSPLEGSDAFGSADQAFSQSAPVAAPEDWTVVTMPGMISTEAVPTESAVTDPSATAPENREAKLLSLVRDLNRCQDVLLGRIHQLEEALESSQQALQAEVERAHHEATPETKATAAQRHSTAQLLSELEQANLTLKRQTILAETLKAQLETSQQRVTQLERECALLQKRHNEKSQALQKSEDNCRDLRSRLQRQQRYTLQFKAALEKSLDMASSSHGDLGVPTSAVVETPYGTDPDTRSNPLAMPRADRIQPWSSSDEAMPQLDPHLMALLRSQPPGVPAAPMTEAVPTAAAAAPLPEAVDDRLWQNLERVIEHSAPAPQTQAAQPASEPEAVFTEPSPWGAPQPKALDTVEPDVLETVFPATPLYSTAGHDAYDGDSLETTHPSGIPGTIDIPASAPVAHSRQRVEELPVFSAVNSQAAPSPLVHPLRPPKKKLTSLSSVDLPSFPPLSSLKKAQ